MSFEWVSYKLSDLATFKYGKFLAKANLESKGFDVYSGYGVVGYLPDYQFERPQIIMVCRGEGGTGDVKMSPPKCSITNLSIIISENQELISKDFLYWALKASNTRKLRTGSAQAQIVIGTLENLIVSIPTCKYAQKEIASILSYLDNRISLLRETNITLEAIAQTLFKSWFVDFDPVKAKVQGKQPEGMDEATAALFPSEFEDSALGLIPKGWAWLPLYDLATYINGAAYKAFQPNLERRGHPIIKIAELKAGVTEQTAYSDVEMPEKYKISPKDILFSWSGNPDTSIDTFVWSYEAAWLNQHIFRVVPNQPNERTFLLLLLKYLRPVFAELARNKQTTGLGHVTVANLKQLLVVYPDKTLLSHFDEVVTPIVEQAFVNQLKIQTLTTLRDTLLPRLISGQLRINQAQDLINEVGA